MTTGAADPTAQKREKTTSPPRTDRVRPHPTEEATASSPSEKAVHPIQLLATMYHALGIDPHTIVHNHLNQPRELVQADPVVGLFS